MSGTKGQVNKRRLEAQAQAEMESASAAKLHDNQSAVMEKLTEIIKDATGWTEIDKSFQRVIDQSLAGGMVNLEMLDGMIEKWKNEAKDV